MLGARSKTIWQVTFIIGLCVCVVAGFVLRTGLLTSLVASAAVISMIIKALLGRPTRQGGDHENWLVSVIKRALNVTWFLKVATVLIWAFSLSFVGYEIYRTSQIAKLEGYVMTAGGDPADEAVVIVTLRGQEIVATTANGKFNIDFDLRGTDKKHVQLRVRWHGIETNTVVDLSTIQSTGLLITLPPGPTPFRVSYHLLGGVAVDCILKGRIDKRWEERLSGQPYIIPNSVFKALSNMADSFSSEFDHDLFLLDTQTKTDERVEEFGLTSFFVGTWRPKYLERAVSRYELRSVFDSGQGWNVDFPFPAEASSQLSDVSFWKFADRTDLARFSDPDPYKTSEWVRFYEHVTKDYLPPDFCFVSIYLSYCGDVLGEDLVARVLQLRVAVIENISSHPIRIGKFIARQNSSNQLRPREVDQSVLSTLVPTEEELFSRGILMPGERILIPLEMSFVFEKEVAQVLQKRLRKSSDTEFREELLRRFSSPAALRFPVSDGTLEITNNDVLSTLIASAPQVRLEKEYIYGHSVRLESVEVDRVRHEFRKFDPDKLVLHAGDESGSCPYIFTYSTTRNAWLNQGEILFGRVGKEKESLDEKPLGAFDGRVLIKENDPETSFIDCLYVRAIDTTGREVRLYPNNEKLRFEDNHYLKLNQGQQVEVEFESPKNFVGEKWSLVAKGYYVPFRKP